MILPLGKTRSRLAFDVPNARIEGRGRTELGETGQSVTPRPLECRVRPLILLLILAFALDLELPSGAICGVPLLRPALKRFVRPVCGLKNLGYELLTPTYGPYRIQSIVEI